MSAGLAHAPWARHLAGDRTFQWPAVLQPALLPGERPGRKGAPVRAVLCKGTFPTCPLAPLNEAEGGTWEALRVWGGQVQWGAPPKGRQRKRRPRFCPSALRLKWLMEKFLIPAVPGATAEEAPGPRATEEEEEGAAKRERPPWPGGSWKKIRAEGLSCDYATLYGRAQADDIFQQLEKEVEYFEGEFTKLHIFGKWHDIPRKQVTYGDAGLTYTYSGVTFSPKPWIPVLNRIRDRVQLVTAHTFNFVLINRYKDGHDHIGEHRDDERELVPRSPIASVSFGARRDFIFRHGASRGKTPSQRIAPVKLQLDHGSLLIMNFPTNHYWYHSLPSRKKVLAPRINLTFRKVRTL